MATRTRSSISLSNLTIRDRDFLFAMKDVADPRGLIVREDVAVRLGLDPEEPSQRRAVSSRLAWMKRYGFADRVDPKSIGLPQSAPPRYIITPIGQALMGGALTQPVKRAIHMGRPGVQLAMMHELAEQAFVRAVPSVANAIRREWAHNAARRTR